MYGNLDQQKGTSLANFKQEVVGVLMVARRLWKIKNYIFFKACRNELWVFETFLESRMGLNPKKTKVGQAVIETM